MRFYGIADSKGLEAFLPVVPKIDGGWVSANIDDYKKEMGIMVLRAQANRHRHAVVYQADLPIPVCNEIHDLLKGHKYEEALMKLKEKSTNILLARSPGAEKSWKLIPNADLDPFS